MRRNGTKVDTPDAFIEDTLTNGASRNRDVHDLPLPGAHVHRPKARVGEEGPGRARLHRTDGFGAVRQHELGRPELGTKDAVDRGVYQRRGTPPRPHGG